MSLRPLRNKYGNRKVTMFGHTFDSKGEAEFYMQLCEQHGRENVTLQPRFVLQQDFRRDGKSWQAIYYHGDFKVGNVVYDFKGVETPVFKLKRKLFLKKFPELELRVVDKKGRLK